MGFKKPSKKPTKPKTKEREVPKEQKPSKKKTKSKGLFSGFNKKKEVESREVKPEVTEKDEMKIVKPSPTVYKLFKTDGVYSLDNARNLPILNSLPLKMKDKILKPYCTFKPDSRYLSELDDEVLKLYKDNSSSIEDEVLNIDAFQETNNIEKIKPSRDEAPKRPAKKKFSAL